MAKIQTDGTGQVKVPKVKTHWQYHGIQYYIFPKMTALASCKLGIKNKVQRRRSQEFDRSLYFWLSQQN